MKPELLTSGFERWASDNGYDIAPAVCPTEMRIYADRQTQVAFDAWHAGACSVIETRKDQMEALEWTIKIKPDDQNKRAKATPE